MTIIAHCAAQKEPQAPTAPPHHIAALLLASRALLCRRLPIWHAAPAFTVGHRSIAAGGAHCVPARLELCSKSHILAYTASNWFSTSPALVDRSPPHEHVPRRFPPMYGEIRVLSNPTACRLCSHCSILLSVLATMFAWSFGKIIALQYTSIKTFIAI